MNPPRVRRFGRVVSFAPRLGWNRACLASSPVAADGKAFVVGQGGQVSVLKAAGDWQVLAVNELDDEVFATPAIADGRVYVRTRSALYSFGR